MDYKKVSLELSKLGNKDYAKKAERFFKTGVGEYGHGDTFIGVRSPQIRETAKTFQGIKLSENKKLIKSKVHEERLLGLIILTLKYKTSTRAKDEVAQKKIYENYISLFKYINNWDLVLSLIHI